MDWATSSWPRYRPASPAYSLAAGGEGLLGLQREFQVAEAPSVVASMWSVGDAETQVLMNRFYQNLLGEEDDQGGGPSRNAVWMLDGGSASALAASRGLSYHPLAATQPAEPGAACRRNTGRRSCYRGIGVAPQRSRSVL